MQLLIQKRPRIVTRIHSDDGSRDHVVGVKRIPIQTAVVRFLFRERSGRWYGSELVMNYMADRSMWSNVYGAISIGDQRKVSLEAKVNASKCYPGHSLPSMKATEERRALHGFEVTETLSIGWNLNEKHPPHHLHSSCYARISATRNNPFRLAIISCQSRRKPELGFFLFVHVEMTMWQF